MERDISEVEIADPTGDPITETPEARLQPHCASQASALTRCRRGRAHGTSHCGTKQSPGGAQPVVGLTVAFSTHLVQANGLA